MKNAKEFMLEYTASAPAQNLFSCDVIFRLNAGARMSQNESGTKGAEIVVLVHGGFVDGSGWESVYKALKKDGYAVAVVQIATTSFAADVATTKRAIAEQNGPVILSCRPLRTVALSSQKPAMIRKLLDGLVYVAAFAPDKGESVSML